MGRRVFLHDVRESHQFGRRKQTMQWSQVMIKRLSSAISTARAISLAIRELPDALREVVEFARENSSLREQLDDANQALTVYNNEHNKALALAERAVSDWKGKHDTLKRELADLRNDHERIARELFEARYMPEDPECEDYPDGPRTWRRAWKMLKKERRRWEEERAALGREISALSTELEKTRDALGGMNRLRDEQCSDTIAVRKNMESAYGDIVFERDNLRLKIAILVDASESMSANCKNAIERCRELTCEAGALKAKLERHEAAERWHQVTDGEGELPPSRLDVLYKLSPLCVVLYGAPFPVHLTFAWRYLSSWDVPQ